MTIKPIRNLNALCTIPFGTSWPAHISPVMLQLPDLPTMQLVLGAAASLGVVGVIRTFLPKSTNSLPLPPSPPNWRLRGHSLPLLNPQLTVGAWIDEYGPLITIRSGTEKIVYIGRYKAAVDIMEKQGASVADRPHSVSASELFSNGQVLAFVHVGETFRRMRRALHTHLQPKAAEAYEPLQMTYAKNTVLDILEDPVNFQKHASAYSSTTITKITYGKNADDSEVAGGRQFLMTLFKVVIPGAYLVDTIPWLKYLPWYGQDLKQDHEDNRKLFTGQMSRVKKQMDANEDIGPSFGRYMLENDYGLTESEMAFLSGSFFAAGSDTTAAGICTILMAAACFPEEQAKVQAEIDAVIGRHRAPTFADQQSLPRLEAFISEAMRWRPLGPGFPHRATKDVIWGNYCIPAGTTVVGSHWAINRDPDVFPDPHAFYPQRWINDKGLVRDDITSFLYGFGRRICPGQHIASRSLFINSALIFWAFQLSLDPTKPVNDMAYVAGVLPMTQPCGIEFTKKISDSEIRRMLKNYPEGASEV
ncbi:cytochrome P450 [Suillus clintonianus]|uniref:cytochrome P450 n=1 Tax=Suillus clintonianus TaxID=1904413 RepID=UPI001B86CE7F|nr:cytochrome P450 [Suillus clintonianus]KAG2137949.1 cytochrome P450 [Suillus clintonianus]